ncbi:electron transfer flavoprotein beta subunit lysine methyltransferase-like [Trichogramma pretiosum]|uniref:ETFB lysine methyltransferase n=1 Tax=Trichogramma kaykai TaxID=54128 RepID=A0ABD2X3X3_9HYME|nr:electron transfer flavoprotein beta subunit lysine methyltransferase-like [Trichogramma pretiosum]XP_014228410.1 electron transfer flavoprotein beta subunit lysine methyltransferase-like [Trichogramma pretiosum]
MWANTARRLSQCTRGKQDKYFDMIERYTKLSREHLTPELQLHLLTPDCPLYTARADQVESHFAEPFWAIYWPGGQAMARYLLDEGTQLFAKIRAKNAAANSGALKVLDVGSGCGAAAIAAKFAGANDVIANDIDQVACAAALLNARVNGVEIKTCPTDLFSQGRALAERFDVLLIGDLLYDEAIADLLLPWLEANQRKHGSEIYIADPGRHGMKEKLRRRLQLCRKYPLPENVRRENHGFTEAAVWKFNQAPKGI